jgi:hypothetical protein
VILHTCGKRPLALPRVGRGLYSVCVYHLNICLSFTLINIIYIALVWSPMCGESCCVHRTGNGRGRGARAFLKKNYDPASL